MNVNQPGQHTYNVLLIEEDPKQTELYSDLIRAVADCRIDVMSRIESSFDWMSRSNYHLVVIDDSADVDSLAILEQIKRISPATSVALISDNATVEEAVAAIRLGAEDYLKKPFPPEAFQLAVKRGLDRKTVFGENSNAAGYLHLVNTCQMISASSEESKIWNIVESYFGRELRPAYLAIYTVNEDDSVRVEVPGQEYVQDRAMEEVLDIAVQASNPLPKMVESGEMYRFVDRGQLTPGLFIFRFRCNAAKDYFCVALSPKRPNVLDAFEGRMRILKDQIEVTGKNIESYKGVQSLVYVDDATGLYNTRYLHYILEREITQALATKKSFAVLFMDADRFKNVNDTHGHLVGTKILHELGHQLKKYVRDADTVFRYGGDEFVAVLSPSDLSTAQAVAERIRVAVEQTSFLAHEGLNLHFTVSIGVALFPDHADSKKAVIDAADQAMYASKRATRNKVTVASGPAVAAPAATPLGPALVQKEKTGA